MPTARNNERDILNEASRLNPVSVRQAFYNGANPTTTDEQGRNGAHLAVIADKYGNNESTQETVSFFLNHGIGINDKDAQGATILHYASQIENYGGESRVKTYIEFGADVSARDKQGRTPLHWAATKGYGNDVIKLLLSKGADINAPDEQGVTPMHLAAARGESGIINTFLAAGVELNVVTKTGKTVWDFAVDAGKDYQAQVIKAAALKQKQAQEEQAAQRLQKAEVAKREAAREEEKEKDPWVLLSPDRVAFSTVEKPLGYKLTEIFNFSARTYTQITHNLATRGEAVVLRTFDEFSDKTLIEKAHKALERLGGTAENTLITGPQLEKPKRNLKLSVP